jgi:hypothetical protein
MSLRRSTSAARRAMPEVLVPRNSSMGFPCYQTRRKPLYGRERTPRGASSVYKMCVIPPLGDRGPDVMVEAKGQEHAPVGVEIG